MTFLDRFLEWFRRVPDWLIVAALGILAGKWYVEREKDKVRKEEQAKAAAREKEAEIATRETIREIEYEGRDQADAALAAARAASPVTGPDGVPDAVARQIFSD